MVGLDRTQVRLEPYHPEWPEYYRTERARLSRAIGDSVFRFEHVGSTAVDGVPAKPVIDILAVVDTLPAASIVDPLETAGYELRAENDDRLFFAKGPEDDRTHYLHVAETRSEYAIEMVAFRDHLRENPDTATAYASLKRSLAERFPDGRDSYTEHKSEFIRALLDRILSSRDR